MLIQIAVAIISIAVNDTSPRAVKFKASHDHTITLTAIVKNLQIAFIASVMYFICVSFREVFYESF